MHDSFAVLLTVGEKIQREAFRFSGTEALACERVAFSSILPEVFACKRSSSVSGVLATAIFMCSSAKQLHMFSTILHYVCTQTRRCLRSGIVGLRPLRRRRIDFRDQINPPVCCGTLRFMQPRLVMCSSASGASHIAPARQRRAHECTQDVLELVHRFGVA